MRRGRRGIDECVRVERYSPAVVVAAVYSVCEDMQSQHRQPSDHCPRRIIHPRVYYVEECVAHGIPEGYAHGGD